MKIEKMWCVEDPGPLSALAYICFEADPKSLVQIVVGTQLSGSGEYVGRAWRNEAVSLPSHR